MKFNLPIFTLKTSVVMVRAALAMMAIATAAHGEEMSKDDAAVAELVKPTSSVEIGVGNVSKGSYKFGEYNGLQRKGAYGIGNIDLESRSPYDGEGTTHLRLQGSNLGLDTRDVTVEYGVQGRFKINLGYDELRRNISDSYQTPFLGTGSNHLSLPSNWLTPSNNPAAATPTLNYRSLSPATAAAAGTAAIRDADLPAFHDYNLHTKRTRYDTGFAYSLDREWEVTGSFRHEKKDGTKLLNAFTAFSGDSIVTLPEQINTTTEQYNLALNYTGEKFFGQVAYYGSVFDNDVNSMNWQDPNNGVAPAANRFPNMGTEPSNQYHEMNFTGGYNFTHNTKLVMNGAYGRNTQNENFLTPPAFNSNAFQAGADSLDGLVITKSLGLKLTTKPTKAWGVAAGYKYNDRDNRTPVNQYVFYDGDPVATGQSPFPGFLGPNGTLLGQSGNLYTNRPMSRTVNQLSLDTDYKLSKVHTIAAGFEWEKQDRSCDNNWITTCASADTTKENTLKAEWRAQFSDDISTRLALAHSKRTVNYNENSWLSLVPLAGQVATVGAAGGTPATQSVYDFITQNGLTGYGPLLGFPTVPLTGDAARFLSANGILGNNGIILQRFYGSRNNVSEQPGFRRFDLADRNRDKVRTSANWQATERLSLDAGVDFSYDKYDQTVYGLQGARDLALNLDGTYLLGENFSFSVFGSYENQRSTIKSNPANIANAATPANPGNDILAGSPCFTSRLAQINVAKIDPCNVWSANMADQTGTLGLALTKKAMLSGKLDMTGSLLFTRALSDISVSGGTYVNNPQFATPGEPGSFFIPAEDLPRVTTDVIELSLRGDYNIDKSSTIRAVYSYQRLKSSADWAYEGLQTGTLTGEMPTNEQVSSYSVNVVGMSYVYRFK